MIGGNGDNIKIDFKDIECESMDWIQLAQNRYPVAGSCEYGIEHLISISVGDCLD
jgi:hypothetical protein